MCVFNIISNQVNKDRKETCNEEEIKQGWNESASLSVYIYVCVCVGYSKATLIMSGQET